jgi:hypothetical protein
VTNILATLLAISVAANAAMGWAYLGQRDSAVTHEVREGTALATAELCSKGTAQLGAAADQREREAAPARQAAADKNRGHQAQAQRIMAKPAAVPGNACASAQGVVDDWWERRQAVKP